MPARLGDFSHALPEVDVTLRVATPHDGFRQLPVEPCMDGWGQHASRVRPRKGHLTIGERTLGLWPHAPFALVAVDLPAIVGANVVEHVRRTSPRVRLAVPHERGERAS